ncbi:PseG/SpsG family protein [Legionella sp. km772]|uniref:PseG/SpsG family protein n=1 Tax=Legionella sp. km772 TaxID=2498111 RepID=UPI000F8C61FB|nr:glycosyl transferase [Legionella sp. km772]RUR08122.1 glycosyl transferase [Legionella sp. km772]
MSKFLGKKVLIVLTEGGQTFGFGHLTRTISIAKQFEEYNFIVHFIVHGDESIATILKDYSLTRLNWHDEFQKALPHIKENAFLLVDSIAITNEQLLLLEHLNNTLVYIDDEKRRNILNKGFVIDWTVGLNEALRFIPRKKNVHYLLGSRYTPLRPGFQTAPKNPLRAQIKQIMISFGGSDVRNLTPLILHYLQQHFSNYQMNVIVGGGFTHVKDLQVLATSKTNLIYHADASMMIQIMQQSDLAIAAGGQTLYELAKIGLPTLGILLVDNAKEDTLGWEEVGFLKYLGAYDDEALLDKLHANLLTLQDPSVRKAMQSAGFQAISGNGGELLVKSILGDHNDSI